MKLSIAAACVCAFSINAWAAEAPLTCNGIEPLPGHQWVSAYRTQDSTDANFSFYGDERFSIPIEIYLNQESCEKGKGGTSWATQTCLDETGAETPGPCCCIGG